jgi:hypothetical protein
VDDGNVKRSDVAGPSVHCELPRRDFRCLALKSERPLQVGHGLAFPLLRRGRIYASFVRGGGRDVGFEDMLLIAEPADAMNHGPLLLAAVVA